MRISDWSSDVCSSDLRQDRGKLKQEGALARAASVSQVAKRPQHLVTFRRAFQRRRKQDVLQNFRRELVLKAQTELAGLRGAEGRDRPTEPPARGCGQRVVPRQARKRPGNPPQPGKS